MYVCCFKFMMIVCALLQYYSEFNLNKIIINRENKAEKLVFLIVVKWHRSISLKPLISRLILEEVIIGVRAGAALSIRILGPALLSRPMQWYQQVTHQGCMRRKQTLRCLREALG